MSKTEQTTSVSVIIPTYNRAHLIGRALNSLANQTYKDFEVVIVDDASTDDTEAYIKGFSDFLNIQYVRHEKNKGEAAARNTGIRAARSEYVAFLDSDDEFVPEKLEKQMAVFRSQSPILGVVYTNMREINSNGSTRIWECPTLMPEDGLVYERALNYGVYHIGIGSSMVRKACFERAGFFDERLSYHVDLDFFIRLSKFYCFYHIKEPLLNYYITGDSNRWNNPALFESKKLILEKYFDDIKKDPDSLSRHYYMIGRFLIKCISFNEGRPYLIKAAIAYPYNLRRLAFVISTLFGERFFRSSRTLMRKLKIVKQ